MKKSAVTDQCADPTQELSIEIPGRLAERVEAYTTERYLGMFFQG